MESEKFLQAQNAVIENVLAELRSGRKRTHWMWFIFPQLKALGRSMTARYYGLDSVQDAQDWLEHPILGARLLECTQAVEMSHARCPAYQGKYTLPRSSGISMTPL